MAGGIVWVTGALDRLPDATAVAGAVAAITVWQWATAALFAAVSYLAAADYERVIHRLLGTGLSDARARRSGFCATALGQAAGMGPVTGAIVRWTVLPGASFAFAARLSAAVAASFLIAWVMVTAVAVALTPDGPVSAFGPTAATVLAAGGIAALAGAAAVRPAAAQGWLARAATMARRRAAPGPGAYGRSSAVSRRLATPDALPPTPRPTSHAVRPARDGLQLLALAATDVLALAAAFSALLGTEIAFALAAAPFLLALGAGLITATPAGLGGFDAALLTLLPGADPATLVAAIVGFRVVCVLIPALVAIGVVLRTGMSQGRARVPDAACRRAAPRDAARIAEGADGPAETGLIRQGHLGVLVAGGALWPLGVAGDALTAFARTARLPRADAGGARAPDRAVLDALVGALLREAQAEGRIPVLYKAEPRAAAAARRAGLRVFAIAAEAVIRPLAFAPESPACAGLRRKLRKARRAGIRVTARWPTDAAPLPLAEMAEVSALWAAAHGGERGFSTGRFAPGYVAGQAVWTATDADGALAGFATFHFGPGEWTLDLMRQRPGAPDGTMHSLIAHAIADAAQAGVSRLSLAAAPCDPDRAGGALAGLYARLARRAGGAGLARFKDMFDPVWEPRYIAAPGLVSMVRAGLAIARAIRRPVPMGPNPGAEGQAAVPVNDRLQAPRARAA
jgi:phosphatidylglycerol lysyltransferase